MARVLVADDEEHILSVMIDVLEGAGYDVVGAKDGEEAVELLQTRDFDVALIDVMMPKVDGYHVAQQVHGLANPPDIVIVTSRDFDGDKRALVAAGAAAFLPKPFSNRELLEVVANLIEKRKAS